jgi:hypothetical protein
MGAAGASASVVFPAELPKVVLSAAQRIEKYGITESQTPQKLKQHIVQFQQWSTGMNFTRSTKYCMPVQQDTLLSQASAIRAFGGFCHMQFGVDLRGLDLHMYRQPSWMAHYIAYLLERGCSKGTLQKHVVVSRKVNNFLGPDPRSMEPSDLSMDGWLGRVELQISACLPKPAIKEIPDSSLVIPWSHTLSDEAVSAWCSDWLCA